MNTESGLWNEFASQARAVSSVARKPRVSDDSL
jgi:hypothetical protein